jgi:hypothetical protein
MMTHEWFVVNRLLFFGFSEKLTKTKSHNGTFKMGHFPGVVGELVLACPTKVLCAWAKKKNYWRLL